MSGYSAGKLRHRVSLQMPITAQDPVTGEQTQTWAEVAEVWAAIEPLSAREFLAAQAQQSKITARIVIRSREVSTTWRAVHVVNGISTRAYNIHGVLTDKDSGLDYVTLPVSTGVNDGR